MYGKITSVAALVSAFALGGCATPTCCGPAVHYAVPPPAPADATLQACANHAAAGLRAQGNADFRHLKLGTHGRAVIPFNQTVGYTHIATVQDGTGEVFGTKTWQKVHFHCLADTDGQVVYSFVRGE